MNWNDIKMDRSFKLTSKAIMLGFRPGTDTDFQWPNAGYGASPCRCPLQHDIILLMRKYWTSTWPVIGTVCPYLVPCYSLTPIPIKLTGDSSITPRFSFFSGLTSAYLTSGSPCDKPGSLINVSASDRKEWVRFTIAIAGKIGLKSVAHPVKEAPR
jgi:hypothetical protein